MTINRPIPFRPTDLVELVALILGVISTTIVWGPVGLLPLGFLWELLRNPLTVYRARPLRLLAVILMASSLVGMLPAIVWVAAHALRVLPDARAHERELAFVERHRGHRVVFCGSTFLGTPSPFRRVEIRSDGAIQVYGPGWRETTKSSNFREGDVLNALWGWGTIHLSVKAGSAHQEKQNVLRVPSPVWVASLLNQQAGDSGTQVAPD